jgi:predicted MFS family arabinose efflux permease
VPPERRPGIFALHNFGAIMGLMLGMVLAGWLGQRVGWRWTFVVLGLPGIALALLVRLTLREPIRGFFDATRGEQSQLPLAKTAAVLWRCLTYRRLMYSLCAQSFVVYGLLQWWPSFYTRTFALELSSVGVHLGIAIGAGAGAGGLLGGLIANQVARRDVTLPLSIGSAAVFVSLPILVGALLTPSVAVSMLLVALSVLLLAMPNGAILAAVYGATPPHMRATAGAITIFFSSVLGLGLGTYSIGLLSDLLAPSFGAYSLRYALLAATCLLPVLAITLRAAARALPHDLKAVGAQTS